MLQLTLLWVSADHGLVRICGVLHGGGREGRSWGDVSLGKVMVEFTLNSHNCPGAFNPRMLLVAGRVETASSLLPPLFCLSSESWYLLKDGWKNLCGFKTTETHSFIQSSYEG